MSPRASPRGHGGRRLLRFVGYFLLSAAVVFTFLKHWSLLDGLPRNGFQVMLDGTAHRPFACRILIPAVVKGVAAVLPADLRAVLADGAAPWFYRSFVVPAMAPYHRAHPEMLDDAIASWAKADYRVQYTVAVVVLVSALMGALFVLRQALVEAGASPLAREVTPPLYALTLPLTNGAYRYDFSEQLFAASLPLLVFQQSWLLFVAASLVGQLNKETALLMPLFLLPVIVSRTRGRRGVVLAVLVTALCAAIYLMVRAAFADSPGNPLEWHLDRNLVFWSSPDSYRRVADMYGLGIPLPRMTFLVVVTLLLVIGWRRGHRALQLTATISLVTLAGLLLVWGFQDEFRALGLSLPLLYMMAASTTTSRPVDVHARRGTASG